MSRVSQQAFELHAPTRSVLCGVFAVLMAAMAGCASRDACTVPGVAETCTCRAGTPGARLCSDDKLWGVCDCSGKIPLPHDVIPGQGGPDGGKAGTGGTGGSAGHSGTGGAGGMMDDDDSGMTVDPDGGLDSGVDAGPALHAYRTCTTDADCDTDAKCIITTNTPPNAVCAPKCVNPVDCPVPEGTYAAKVVCFTGYCGLDCTPAIFQPLLTCPEGMACVAALIGQSYCYDDGM
jgi:hypothetical protein